MAAMSKKQQLKPPPAKDALNGRQSGNGSLRQSVDEDKTPKGAILHSARVARQLTCGRHHNVADVDRNAKVRREVHQGGYGPCATPRFAALTLHLTLHVNVEIDMAVLPLLTEAHLERMGIPTIGARLHLLAAIAQLRKRTEPHKSCRNLP